MTEVIRTWACPTHGSLWNVGDRCYTCEQSFERIPLPEKDKDQLAQVGGTHYAKMDIDPFEYSMRNGLDPLQHTAIKYISRFRDKGGVQDLLKAKHTIDRLIQFEQEKSNDR